MEQQSDMERVKCTKCGREFDRQKLSEDKNSKERDICVHCWCNTFCPRPIK